MICGENAVCDTAAGVHVSLSNSSPGPRHAIYLVCKTGVEWVAALVLLAVLAPLIGILAVLVKLTSPGPAFYSQTRLGYRGKEYRIFKLRTMRDQCEAMTGPVWSSGKDDPRVTRFGRLLRDTHLDELPQLWNVLRGEMSLVGPRPERPEIAVGLQRAMPSYNHRLLVRPGVTGLAQVQLPPDIDLESVRHKLAYDLHYVREVSFVLDLRIIFATALHFTAVSIKAVGEYLVRSEKVLVESKTHGSPTIVPPGTWRVGAA